MKDNKHLPSPLFCGAERRCPFWLERAESRLLGTGKIKQDGYTLVPLSLYFKGPRVKVEIGLCKGKKLYDKREAAAKKDAKREMDRALKQRR